MFKAVIFDLDDTLYDELDYCKSGFASVADFLAGLPKTPPSGRIFDALWRQFSSGNHKTTFNAALDHLAITYDDNLIAQLVETYRTHVPDITLPADSESVLKALSDKFTLALLTDGFLPAQKLKVQALGIEKYFKSIIYTEQLGRQFWKPSPAGFEKIMNDLNTTPQNTACVADNEKKDFIAPNNLGCTTIQLIRPNRIHSESSTDPHAAPQHVIRNISDLPPLLQKL
jgi:putative hydrolase of the HAD superfamily